MADEQIVTSIVAKADLSSLVSEVHRASASLQQLQRELLASNKAISSSTKLANNLFRDTLTGSGQFSSHFVNLNSDVDKFGKNLDAGRLKLKNYFQTFREHSTTQKGMIRELAKEQVMLQNSVLQPLGRNAQGLMQYNVMIPRGLDAIANSGKLARMEMQIMNRALSEGAGSLINWGKNTQWAGRQLTVGLTVPLTMFGAAAGKAFREADAELVRLTKVYGGLAATSAADLKAIREEVVETAKVLSKTMGASFKDTIALGADIAATGQTGDELLGSIAETTRLAILGEVDRQDAMKATLSIQTAFKQNTEQLTESINFLNAVENQTSTTLNDLVEAIPKAGPVIQQLGGDVKDLALYLTAMREGGISASEGANALKSGLASLINPTKQTVGMMSDFGIDVMGMVAKNTGDTTGLLMDLQKALDSLDPLSKARAMEQMFGKFQFARMSALLNNLGKQGSQTLQVLDLMKASTADLADVASRELKMVTESASGKYKRAIEGLKAELADVGEEFLGVATKLISAATKILDFFTKLPDPIKKGLTFLAGFTALVGPLIMLTGVLANFFGYITKGVVQLRAFFMKANGWKMLTPEIIAAEKAALMVENAFYSDAAAAQVLHNALQKLVLDYQNLQAASMKNAVPVNGGVSTVAGNPVMVGGRRVVDPNDPYVGDPNTRAMSHIRPRDLNNPATIFGGVPGAIPVNRGISRTPQMYMHDRLPNIEGLTSVKGISTGIVPGEAAKFHALMATLGMQTEQEVAMLKKTIAMGGTVSAELLSTFDDILPITQKFANSAAEQSALIVQQMRNAEITVEQAKARILALNAQIEAEMGSAVTAFAAGRGRRIDLTRAPMMDQPVVDANGQFTLRDLYKKKTNASVMEEFGRLRGVRTFGAPYSIQTTRLPKFNIGGEVESFGPSKTIVSGPSSIGYDDRLGSVPLGGYVLNQQASMDPANAALVAMAPSTYLNDGGSITAALTPRETVFGPEIQRMPDLYAAVDAANNGYNFGGQIMKGINSYGKKMSKSAQARMKEQNFKRQYREYLKFINNPRYEDDIRVRMIMLDAAELSYHNKLPIDKAINIATSNFDKAKVQAGGSDENFVKIRIKQVQGLERDGMVPRVKNGAGYEEDGKTVYPRSGSKALNWQLNDVREAMLANKKFAGVHDLIAAIAPTTFLNASDGSPSIGGMHDKAHFARKDLVGYTTSGYMGVGAVIPAGINNIMSTLETIGLSRDVLNLSAADAKENLAIALKKTGLDKFASVDDIFAALQDDGKIKSKADWKAGRVVRANRDQKNSLMMLLEAAAKRSKWVFAGRPPRPMLVSGAFNSGGMIPGGSISRNRKNYGFVSPALRLLAPAQQLKILQQAREMSALTPAGYIPASYSHLLTPSTGRSFPVPGVAGVYQNEEKKRVFFKAVPNETSLTAEMRGTEIGRILGLETPVQVARSIRNPLDPTGKSRFLGAESDYDEGFINPNTSVPGKFSQDEVLDQFVASMILANKDLSRSNVHGRRLSDVGNGGVLAKASMNDDYAKSMPSMEEMAMINLLQVKGGARKDFARDTAPIIAKMTAKEYGDKIREKMEAAYPQLKAYIKSLPKKDRKPYDALLKRFEEGMDVDWSKYHAMHVNPKYLNAGGPVGGGPVQRSRYAYGRKKDGSRVSGNPAKRAQQEKLKAERASTPVSGSGYTSSGNPQMQVFRAPYVGGSGVSGNAFGALPSGQSQQAVDMLRLSQLGQLPAGVSRSFKSLTDSIKLGTVGLRYGISNSIPYLASAYKSGGQMLMNSARQQSSAFSNWIRTTTTGIQQTILREQAKRTVAAYPGQMMPISMSGPGLVGSWKDTGQEGIKSRKVGTLGYRKTEFMGPDGKIMNSKEAQAAGIDTRRRGGMGMGAQMGIGMAGSMVGMGLMQQEKVFGMSGMTAGIGIMAASSILPMLPWVRMASAVKTTTAAVLSSIKAIKSFGQAIGVAGGFVADFYKKFKAIGWVAAAAATVFDIYKTAKDAQQDAAMAMGLTEKAAEQAGVKYFNLNQYLSDYIEKQKLANAAAQASKNNSVGMPGIPQSVADMKKAKEDGAVLKDLIESINRSESKSETIRLISNQKAQYIAGGLSLEESNKMIYGAIANSEKASQAYQLLANSGFGSIIDKSTAAEFAVGNLIDTINAGPFGKSDAEKLDYLDGKNGKSWDEYTKELSDGLGSVVNIFNTATQSLIGTKDGAGNVIDEFKAYEMVMASSEKKFDGFNKAIGQDMFRVIKGDNPELAKIINQFDTLKSILAKSKLFTSGINIDLSKIDSNLAIKLAGFTSAIGTGISDLTNAAKGDSTYGTVGKVLERLQKSILATSVASQRAAAASQRSIQEEIKLISKKINLIEDEKNKKLSALRATQDASNYALELQKLQNEYADAVARGDMSGAASARISIDQLTSNRQSELAQKAIEDEAARLRAIEQKKIDAKQAEADKKAIAFQNRQDGATDASEIADVIKGFKATYDELTSLQITNSLMPESEAKRKADRDLVDQLNELLKKIGVSGTGKNATAVAIREAFAQYFNKDGTIKSVVKESAGTPSIVNGVVTPTTVTSINKATMDLFMTDVLKVSAMADQITGGKGYNIKTMTAEIVAAIRGGAGTASDPINAGTTLGQLGQDKINWGNKYLPNSDRNDVKKLAQQKGYKPGTQFYLRESDGTIKQFLVLSNGEIQLQKVTNKADGGPIRGEGTGTSDSIPAMLSNGEYVVRASSVAKYGVETLDALNAQKLHKGGPAGHRHGRNLPGSLFKWKPYAEDMPDYWSDGTPSGSPYSQRWGALRYGPAKGKDIWGGTEIPGLPFNGKIPNRSDYWHQIYEQPSKTQGYSGMGIDKEPPRYAGSGASMSGIGNGVYGAGSWLTFANGGPVDVNAITKAFRWFKNAMNNGTNPGSAMIMDLINQAGYLGQTALSGLAKGVVPKPTKEQDKSFQEFTGVPSIYRSVTNKTSEGPAGQIDPLAGKIVDYAGALAFLTPWRSSGRMAATPAATALSKQKIENSILRFKRFVPSEGVKINTKAGVNSLISRVAPDDAVPYDLMRDWKMRSTSAGEYSAKNAKITMPPDGMSGGTAVHEYAHHLDFTTKNWSFDAWVDSLKNNFDETSLTDLRRVYDSGQKFKLGHGQAAVEALLTKNAGKFPNLLGNYRAVQEGIATDKTAGLYNSLIREGKIDLARLIGNPYMNGTGYFNSFTHMASVLDADPAWRSPAYPEGFLASGASKAMPPDIRARYQSWVDKMKEYEITPGMSEMDPKWVALKWWAKENNFANGGLVGYHKGGPVGHRHGRNLPLTQKQLAQKNKNLSYYESKIDDPINNYSKGHAKIFTHSPFGIAAPIVALAADLFGVYFQGKSPGFGKNGIKDLNPTSYEPHVSALMKGMINPYAEIAKGSATTGDWINGLLSLIPGAGLVGGANKARISASAYKAVNKASIGLPAEARVGLIPNSVLRSNFVALKKDGNLNTPEFAQARYELALSDALKAAKRNKFTALPDLKNTTAAKLIEENKNLPSSMEESIKIDGKDFIFRFQKGDILPTDAPYIDKFIAGLKEGKETSKTFSSGGMHQAEILDPATKKQLSWINYDPVTGYIHYRGTHVPYRGQHLSEALYNKAVSITRIKHSPSLTDMGRPSALRMGGFMDDDPYYGASTSLTGFKQYIDALMKLGKSKKPKPSTGEPRSGIGSWLNSHTPLRQPSQPPSQPSGGIGLFDSPEYLRFNDRNSVIGWQDDRLLRWDSAAELRSSLRPEVVEWFGSNYRTSANFPYGHNGYIESGALPELERIIALERTAKSRAYLGLGANLPRITFANGGLAQNFSNSALSNLGIPMFEDGINMVPADMLALLHKNEAVVPANMNPFNPNASAATSSSVYNIKVDLNGTNVTAQDVATAIHREMKLKEMAAGINRTVGGR